ncbi:MAG: glycosyltransferase family 4 protein [bacterium]|nr:glycosyltransferase family 4 protein [bacterium]
MKLLHVISTLDVGGAEVHLLSQVRGQVARGHQVRVAWVLGEGRLTEEFRAAGAEWTGCVGKGLGFPFRLRKHLAWCDLVHSHLLRADFATALTATLLGKRRRLVAGKHNDEQALKRPLVSRLHGWIGNLPVRTIVLSDHVGRFIETHGRVRPDKIIRVYYGIDPSPFEAAAALDAAERAAIRAEFGFAETDAVFLCVARFAPQKAHDVLLRAFAAARTREGGERLKLLLVGDDPFGDGRERTEAVAREAGLIETGAQDPVVFAGIRRDVPRLLAASDVFVMSSLWEGLGLVFLEAMAAGLPVLATRVSAVPEVVVEGVTGRLVAPAEEPPLADAFLELAQSPERCRALGAKGRQRVREVFALDRMVEETLEVYERILGT